ncbi:MAG TPA: hypothetical protein PKY08_00645 [Candidatus Magasanikbacteria bacterium]|nr:hypothetical protein [Candidatus Magasanikbacteria bacterium]
MDSAQPVIHDFTPSPIEEPALKNRGSCLWKLISLIITLIILAVVVFSVISLFYSGPTIKRIAALPAHFPTDIPLYDFGNRSSIQYQNAQENDKLFNRLALIPKYIFGPITLKFKPYISEEEKFLRNKIYLSSSLNFSDLKKLLQPTSGKTLDIIEIDWENLNSSPKKIFDFYKKNFVNQDYEITKEDRQSHDWEMIIKKNDITGELTLLPTEEKNKTQKVILKINFPTPQNHDLEKNLQ